MARWLTAEEQASWRAWIAASTLLPERLSRDLVDEGGMTLADYELLMYLSEAPGRRLRMSDLAAATLSSRSRLSHQVDRLADSGLVAREPCSDDRRGAFAVLTDAGWDTVVETAPLHVESVRRRLVDVLTPEEFAELGRLCSVIAERLRDADPDHCDGEQSGG